jgi:uncharacterized membrane protein YuzA (DUF378 family)
MTMLSAITEYVSIGLATVIVLALWITVLHKIEKRDQHLRTTHPSFQPLEVNAEYPREWE